MVSILCETSARYQAKGLTFTLYAADILSAIDVEVELKR